MKMEMMSAVFIPNAGQANREIHYYIKGLRHRINFMEDGVVLVFFEPPGNGYAVALRFLGANRGVKPEGRHEASGRVHYLTERDPANQQTDLVTYEEIVYRELWPHVDMVFRGGNGRVKYEFVVQPGARVEDIQLTYRGADSLSLDESGNLIITTPTGTLTDERPVAIQEKDGKRIEVESAFLIKQDDDGHQSFGFVLDAGYDPQVSLVIDPGLVFSTFLSGSGLDHADRIAIDREGNIYVAGYTKSVDFPITEGAFNRTFGGYEDVFVTKMNAAGSTLIYSTYIGKGYEEIVSGIAVDSEGNVYVAGGTYSDDFPTTEGAYKRTKDPYSMGNGFIFKLNAQGNSLIYSTFLSRHYASIKDIKVDSEGNAYITGCTGYDDLPTTEGAYESTDTLDGGDIFVTKLNAMGSELVYSTFLGTGVVHGMALDAECNVYVTGYTASENYPTTEGAYDRTYHGKCDVFVTKLNATGTGLVYSTFLGGSDWDEAFSITVDSEGNAYVVGNTKSEDFPTTEGAYSRTHHGDTPFVTKLNATGTALVYSTLLGGDNVSKTFVSDIAVDHEGNAYVTGVTNSENFPITDDAFQKSIRGERNVFIAKLNKIGSALLYSTYLGGGDYSKGGGIVIDSASHAYVVGSTDSPNFPTTEGAFDRTKKGDEYDGFVTKWNLTTPTIGADLSLTVADMPESVSIGTPLTYTIQVRNHGPQTAKGVKLTDILPLYTTFVSASSTKGHCSILGKTVTCEIGSILIGETVRVSITMLPTQVGKLQCAAFVSGNTEDLNRVNNTVVVMTEVNFTLPREEILDLIGMVDFLILVGVLTQVQASLLNHKLWAAIEQLDAGNVAGACGDLHAFSQKIISYNSDEILDVKTANQMLRAADAICDDLGCE